MAIDTYPAEMNDVSMTAEVTRVKTTPTQRRSRANAVGRVVTLVQQMARTTQGGESKRTLADAGLLRSLGKKPIWEGVWPCLDSLDTVCLRTASMEWNVPEKYGPYGVLLFFLIQKKPAIEPNSEAFNSFLDDGFSCPRVEG